MKCLSYMRQPPMASIFMALSSVRKFHVLTRNSKLVSPFLALPNAKYSAKICSNRNHSKTSVIEDDEDFEEVKKDAHSHTHAPVMINEVLKVFEGRPLRSFVDCTLGAAGHSSAIIKAHPEIEIFIGLDVDPAAHEQAQPKLQAILDENQGLSSGLKLNMVCKNFREIKSVLKQVDQNLLVDGVDGILMDLGMSSMQLDNAERGFSVLYDGPLDMRMNPTALLRAEEIVNTWPEAKLGHILRDYGEESRGQILQRKIAEARLAGGIHSTSELVELVRRSAFKFSGRQGWMKTAIRVFQALRIAVNDELKTLENALADTFTCLASKGRIAVISFHSLEDRIVKQSFLNLINNDPSNKRGIEDDKSFVPIPGQIKYNKYRRKGKTLEGYGDSTTEEWMKHRVEGKYAKILTKRPIMASKEEENVNRRCRSAKLRVLEKN